MRASIVLLSLSLAACKGDGTDPNAGTPAVVWSDESLDFGIVALGETAELTFDITNDGGGMLEVYTVVVSEGDRDQWSVAWDSSNRALARGESLSVSVFFTPEQADRRSSGRVQVRTNDDDVATFFVPVTGESAPSNADNDGDGITVAGGDCDDDDPNVYPGAPELCNGRDDNCQGGPGPDEVDNDGDGVRLCANDCDDNNGNVYPGAPEACDGLDSDCDGVNQDNADADGDGMTVCDGDCNDANPNAYPGNTEVCADNVDNDCDGTTDRIDLDGDGHDVCSATGDCDDADVNAHPLIVSTSGGTGAAGTPADPLDDVGEALGALDAVCRTIYVEPGTYTVAGETWSTGTVTIVGRGAAPTDVVFDADFAGRHLDITGGTVTVRRVSFENGAAPTGQNGGAVRVANATATFQSTDFVGNSTDSAGGAVFAAGSTVSLQQTCVFANNVAGDGGALAVDATTLFDANGSTFTGNTATGAGGAVHANGATLIMAGSTFDGNIALTGGALAVSGGGGHLVQRGRYFDNSATAGAAAWFSGTSDGTWRNNFVRDNNGGGAWLEGAATLNVVNNTFTSNVSTGDGAAILVDTDNANVLGNIGHFNDGQSGLYATPGSLSTIEYNTVFATSTFGADFAGAAVVGVGENLAENPNFVAFTDNGDPNDDDLSLGTGSPAIDTGPPASNYNDTDGTRNDRGATGGPGGQ
ncbi:MAG: right-handed parallel beta-helix repeat-containing protein [Alphaproteobacteria bacterium]|nr:right-handed parallel beta-helix repeat-containing protein [Alphaproteobacteria bacterium]